MGRALAVVGIGAVAAAAIYGGLAFQTTVTGNTQAAVGAGIGIALGLGVGMMGAPDIGAGIAAGGVGVALAQFATAEVASYEANQTPAATTTTSGINGPADRLPLHASSSLSGAKMRLRQLGMR